MSPDKDHQMQDWHREELKGQAYLHFGCAGLLMVGFLFLILTLSSQRAFAGTSSSLICAVVGFVIFGIVILIVHGWNAWQDTQDEELAVVEGTIKLQFYMAGKTPVFSLKVANESFNITYQKYKELQNGEHYRIHYGPRSKIVVDTELL